MARIGRRARVRILVLTVLVAVCGAEPAGDPQSALATTLAVQDAMRQGRDHLQNGRAKDAIDVLEAQLARINGNAAYLALLREAYAAYLKALQLAHQDEQCAA